MIDQEIMDLMKSLDKQDEHTRMKLLSGVDEQRNELLGVLLKHLNTSPSQSVRVAAIYLIGRHRLSDGVNELIQQIDLQAVSQGPGAEPLWEQFPAMEALINIGRPSVNPVVEMLTTEANELRRDLGVKVIRYVEDAEIAKLILQRAHTNESDSTRKEKLQDALVRLGKLPQ